MSLELSSKEETPETNFHDKIKKDLLSDFRNLLITYTQFNELNTYLEDMVKKGEKIMSKTALIERYNELTRVLVKVG
ncbi:MAG: hypothetical protein IPO06_04450 [Leptospiraceae bacterium]|nr:hypothetical protein [Leptospiraceae bacterium]